MGLVLVIEDDGVICQLVRIVLEEAGFRTVTAPNAGAALALLPDHRPGLILLDSSTGLVSEGEFIRRYRAQPAPHAPVILFTAGTDAAGRMARIGADGVLAKPFDVDDLVALVRRHVSADRSDGPDAGDRAV